MRPADGGPLETLAGDAGTVVIPVVARSYAVGPQNAALSRADSSIGVWTRGNGTTIEMQAADERATLYATVVEGVRDVCWPALAWSQMPMPRAPVQWPKQAGLAALLVGATIPALVRLACAQLRKAALAGAQGLRSAVRAVRIMLRADVSAPVQRQVATITYSAPVAAVAAEPPRAPGLQTRGPDVHSGDQVAA